MGTISVSNATPSNAASVRSMRSRACTPKASERPADAVTAEAIDTILELHEENLRLREHATPKNTASIRSMRSRAGTPKASERPADAVAAEAIDTLRDLHEENLRLREENIEIREMSMATQSLADETVNLARSLSPVRKRPAESLSVFRSPPLSNGVTSAHNNPKLLGRLSSAPGSAASAIAGRTQCAALGRSDTDPFQPIGAVGPQVQRCCASLAQSNSSRPNEAVSTAAVALGRLNASPLGQRPTGLRHPMA